MKGASGVGISVKSGQIAQLKRWFFRISMVAAVEYTVSGFERMPPTVSTRNGIEVTWSRCECVTKIWSICESSASVRSPTPVPASIRMSLSRRNEVVRRWRPPIPPEQPSTRKRMARAFLLLLVEHAHAVPVGRRRLATHLFDSLQIHFVKPARRTHALQIEHLHFGLVPRAGAVGAQCRLPQLKLPALPLQSERLIDA